MGISNLRGFFRSILPVFSDGEPTEIQTDANGRLIEVLGPGDETVGRIKLVDNNGGMAQLDAFNRIEMAEPFTLGDYIFKYGLQPLLFDKKEVGSGTVTHLPQESSVRLRVTTASGDVAQMTSRRYHRYQAGKAGEITLTGVIGDGKENVKKQWGYFDDNNGLFFQLDGTEFSVVQRSSTSGSVVDEKVAQASFNGGSIASLDFNKGNIFKISFQWLGVGETHFRVYSPSGALVAVHTFHNVNAKTAVYMSTANLPIRYRIENTGTSASQTDMKQICSSVVSSGGEEPPENEFAQGNSSVIATADANELHLISFRLASTFNSIENRALLIPKSFSFTSDKGSCIFRVRLNGTVTGGTWVAVDTNSVAEYNRTATSFTPGMLIQKRSFLASGPATSTNSFQSQAGVRKLVLSRSADNASSDIITITVQRLTTTNVDALAEMEWGEAL